MHREQIDAEFLAYVEQHQSGLRALAYRLCGDRGLAEDAVQNALVKAYLRWSRIDTVHPYVKRAVVTAVLDEFRKPWHRSVVTDTVPETSQPEGTTTVDDRLLLRQGLNVLPPRQRAAVLLRYVEDLDLVQTAALMRCRPSTVANAAAAALASLRTFLTRHGVVRGTARTQELP